MDLLSTTSSLYETYTNRLQEIADIRYATALLQWDQETYMPPGSIATRSRQIATLSELAHVKFTEPATGELIDTLLSRADLTAEQQANLVLSSYDFAQQGKLPAGYVRELSETISHAFTHWTEARKNNSFPVFAPWLEKLVTLKKKEAALLGYTNHPYDALLNQYERGCTTQLLDQLFAKLQPALGKLIETIRQEPQVDDAILLQPYPEEQQWAFSLELLEKMGYDFQFGRQDKAAHPFTINFSSDDVRITTRVREDDISYMTWSTIHELGHALYELGLPKQQYGLPLGEAASLGIHESQSRLWENNIGRSQSWCACFFPVLREYFPKQLNGYSSEDLFRAINKVQPSLIRTEADELTYHFHIMIRYEVEKALIEGSLEVAEVPAFWKERYRHYLGVTVPDDANGCLQDVHWSHGSFGYFPTYSLGSIYAAQFYATLRKQVPKIEKFLQEGDFSVVKNWLSDNIYIHGRRYTSEELCKRITGKGIDPEDFMQYASAKYRFIYAYKLEGITL
ncbi:carboxypeptidase M32 [Flavihumibacter sp. CACIAM 22H1]|uniref:carboxypeptidase M32 n=1 Tax=Flavihumibacter sp. CACIAM 22H1 TaxID=1812911 RepID=UPI0007A8BAC7|nr:carboxypeptidase M32 [Flavihumibacter sp. CACIAM 22H1]KYP16233.1 MAG: carboxypeptidase [Flavihumibacter sp. CACIAM 22H1]